MNSNIKIGISAKFHKKAPVFYGECDRHIQYLETSIAKWIARNGALPFMIPSESDKNAMSEKTLNVKGFAQEMDALILQGGVDVHPSLYSSNEEFLEGKYDLVRDKYELDLIKEFINLKKPIFGICRGMQLLNVFFGGELYKDLEELGFTKHFDKDLENKLIHQVRIENGPYFGTNMNELHNVVSIHHQGIKTLGAGLEVEANSTDDNLIEAFSKIDEEHFIIAVQWHPELHIDHNTNLMDENYIFQKFLQVAKNRKYYGDLSFDKKRKVKLGKSNELTLGVELELQIIDPKSKDLAPKAPQILEQLKNLTPKIKSEIFQSMIEIETGICFNAHEVEKDLVKSCQLLHQVSSQNNLWISSAGTHAFAKYSERILTDGDRYKNLLESKQWIARRIAIFGLHCHVGVQNPEQAIDLYRFYLSIAPLLLGISASSPFFQSENTGLYSVRSTFFESTPTGGHPPIINNWAEFEGILSKLFKSRSITSHKDLWWDVRPSITYGTIEVRICDMMPSLYENVVLVALIQLLGRCFIDNKDHKIWPSLEEWSYRENKWRALRFGINFDFIFNEQGNTISAKEYIKDILNIFEDQISAYNYKEKMNYLVTNMLEQCPSDRILALYKEKKDLSEIVGYTCKQFFSKY